MQEGDGVYIKVFTYESYVNTNHASNNAYLPADDSLDVNISQKYGKGRRLIILYAITEYGTLYDTDLLTGEFVNNFNWKGETCQIMNKLYLIMFYIMVQYHSTVCLIYLH